MAENNESLSSNKNYTSLKQKLSDVNLYGNALHLQSQLKLVGDALDKLQSDSVTLSDAVSIWLKLVNHSSLDAYQGAIKQRFSQAITSFHLLAYMVDPTYFGIHLSFQQEEQAQAWLEENYSNFVADFLLFRIKDDEMYPKSMFAPDLIGSIKSNKWWSLIKMKTEKSENPLNPDMCEFV